MSWDKSWESLFLNRDSWGKYPEENLVRFIFRNFGKNPDKKNVNILEIGCGPGGNLSFLSREGFNVHGIDASKTALKKASGLLEKEGLSAELIEADLINHEYKNSYYDAVIDIECLYSNSKENTRRILEKIHNSLKHDGLFFSRSFTNDMRIGENYIQVGNGEYTKINVTPFIGMGLTRLMTREDINSLYSEFFKIISVDKLTCSYNDGEYMLSEWLIHCKKS